MAFLRWAVVAPAIVVVGAILLKLLDAGSAVGYTFPFVGIGIAVILFVAAPVSGLATRTALPSLLGALAGLILAFMLGISIL